MEHRELLAQSGCSVAKTVTSGELGIVLVEGNALVVIMYQMLEASGGNNRHEDKGIE